MNFCNWVLAAVLAFGSSAVFAFAATMAARDLQSFARFISDDAVCINGGQPVRGKPAILEDWGRFVSGTTAPVSW